MTARTKTSAAKAANDQNRDTDLTSHAQHQMDVEMRHLKNTIAALRDKMESVHFQKDEEVQKAVALSNDEIIQLKDTVSALREQLETLKYDDEERIQAIERNARDEIAHLHDTITTLRTKLEGGPVKKKKTTAAKKTAKAKKRK